MSDEGRIFISYSHDDSASVNLLPRLQTHLAFLNKDGIEMWDDRRIEAGTSWKKAIDDALADARAAILLISPALLSSEFVRGTELPALRRAVDQKRIALYPLLVTECAWDRTELADIQLFNRKPLGRMRANASKDAILAELARQIHAALELPEPEPEPVVIAVMGAKGGVGKGTFTTCVAHLFAGSGEEVAVIDCDLQDSGVTREASVRRKTDVVGIRTAYQHIAPHSRRFENHPILANEALWDITPMALAERKKGRIWLLPSGTQEEKRGGFDIVANIDLPREGVLEEVLRGMIARIRTHAPNVRWILIDCGAGTNPLYSAAFAVATYGYIILLPDASYFGAVDAIKAEHRHRYPDADLLRVFPVANMVTSDKDRIRLEAINPVAMIPRDPVMQADQFDAPVDFEFGYDDVTSAVYTALERTFEEEHRKLLPDPIAVHIRPWWNQLVTRGLARRVLADKPMRARRFACWVVVALLLAASAGLLAILIAGSLERPVSAIAGFHRLITYYTLAQILLLLVAWYLIPLERNIRLLKTISALHERTPEEMRVLHDILSQPDDRATMRWLRGLVQPTGAA